MITEFEVALHLHLICQPSSMPESILVNVPHHIPHTESRLILVHIVATCRLSQLLFGVSGDKRAYLVERSPSPSPQCPPRRRSTLASLWHE